MAFFDSLGMMIVTSIDVYVCVLAFITSAADAHQARNVDGTAAEQEPSELLSEMRRDPTAEQAKGV